jgi:GNAT superfamily N-acetyltransferase
VSSIEVRPFRRGDRDQLTDLLNAHAAAVVPGMAVSVATVLGQLEREPGEFIVDPWVSERVALVAEQAGRIAAASLVLRYGSGLQVGPAYRGTGAIRWLVFWPEAPASANPYWTDGTQAADKLIAACTGLLSGWDVTSQGAEGELPVPGVYGIPEQWPHIRALYERAGFVHTGHTEVVYLATTGDLPHPAGPPLDALGISRTVGLNGTRLSAVLGEEVIGYIEVEILDRGERLPSHGKWADVGNLHVTDRYRRRGVATWLLGQAAGWLRLAQVDRLLDYADLDGRYDGYRAFLAASGFRELTRTKRGWTRQDSSAASAPGSSG